MLVGTVFLLLLISGDIFNAGDEDGDGSIGLETFLFVSIGSFDLVDEVIIFFPSIL